MRILHVVHTPRYSGAEMLVLALTKLHTEMGHTSAVLAMFPAEHDFEVKIAEQKEAGIEWFTPNKRLSRLERLMYLRRIHSRYAPDITFAHSVLPAAYVRIACKGDVIPVLHAEDNYSSKDHIFSEYFLQYLAKGVITVSPRSELLYKNRYKSPKISCIPNGINIKTFDRNNKSDNADIRIEIGVPADACLVVLVGRVSEIKQQYLSIRALKDIVNNDRNIHILIAGILEEEKAVQHLTAQILECNLQDNVHMLGPRNDIQHLLQTADLYLMPSKTESQGIALIEALAAGIPIVASNIPAFSYANDMAGVTLIDPLNSDLYCHAIQMALLKKGRFVRNLDDFDIAVTAQNYIDFAMTCN